MREQIFNELQENLELLDIDADDQEHEILIQEATALLNERTGSSSWTQDIVKDLIFY